MEIRDNEGVTHSVKAIGVDTIMTLPSDPELDVLKDKLLDYPANLPSHPQGQVDLLLGLLSSSLHGHCTRQWGDLRLLHSKIGSGWSLRGSHECLQPVDMSRPASISAEVHHLQVAWSQLPQHCQVLQVASVFRPSLEFPELDELGTAPPPVCQQCAGCKDCTFRRKRLTLEEQQVVSRIESDMKVDLTSRKIYGKYPWKDCAQRMRSNESQVRKIQSAMERHMIRAGTHTSYIEEMEKFVTEGKVRRLSQGEMDAWHGPVHFIVTFAVIKPDSLSTRVRVVSNSALRNALSKLSLNDCMHPGPNALAELLDCLIFWRSVECALMLDLKKAYQAIYTGDKELHLRRLLYRRDPREDWEIYGFTRATFGDVLAGLLLEVAKRRVADLGSSIDPQASQQLKDNSYVDDSILGGTPADIERMRGRRTEQGYTGTVARILNQGGMSVKFMAVSGSSDPEEDRQLGGKSLGVCYRLRRDKIYFVLPPCYYSGKSTSSDVPRELVVLSRSEVKKLAAGDFKFTRRQALSMVMSMYDPLGLVSPALVRGKMLLRRLYEPEVAKTWDSDLPQSEKSRWADWFNGLLDPIEATFPRSTRPRNATGEP